RTVTGVQTCALPIYARGRRDRLGGGAVEAAQRELVERRVQNRLTPLRCRFPLGRDRHAPKLVCTYFLVKRCCGSVDLRVAEAGEIGRASCRERVGVW